MSAQNEISASETPGVYGAEAGGEPFSPRSCCCEAAARHPIAAHAADPSLPVAARTTAPRVSGAGLPQNLPGGDNAARLFWERVASGAIELQPHEDRLIWTMRTRNRPWPRIAARIIEMRAVAQNAKPRTIHQYRRAMRAHRIAQSIRKMMGKS